MVVVYAVASLALLLDYNLFWRVTLLPRQLGRGKLFRLANIQVRNVHIGGDVTLAIVELIDHKVRGIQHPQLSLILERIIALREGGLGLIDLHLGGALLLGEVEVHLVPLEARGDLGRLGILGVGGPAAGGGGTHLARGGATATRILERVLQHDIALDEVVWGELASRVLGGGCERDGFRDGLGLDGGMEGGGAVEGGGVFEDSYGEGLVDGGVEGKGG